MGVSWSGSANLPLEAISSELADHVCGIYLGWAALPLPHQGVYKMVMSVGWNPFFDNAEKAVVRVWGLGWLGKLGESGTKRDFRGGGWQIISAIS